MKRLFTFFAAAMMLSLVGCSLLENIPLPGTGNEQEEEQGNENTGSEIPEEPLTSGPATVAITRATATTAKFEGSITNDEIDLDFLQITLRYAEPDVFSAMNADLPNVVVTRPDFDDKKMFAFKLENLKYNTTYKFCAVVQYKNEVFYSDVQEFKTAGVNVYLEVKDGAVTENSAEVTGSISGISKEDADKLEVGFYYSPDKALVEKGEGTKIVLDNAAEGVVSVLLTDLYIDGPTYHLCSYVKQGEESKLGKVVTFELINEPVRLVKKITRHEDVLDDLMTWTYEFEYENNKLVGSKWTEVEEEYVDDYRFTYDYSTKGKVIVDMYYVDGSEEELEDTYEIAIDAKGNALNYKYTWDDDWGDHIEYYHYDVNFTYTPEGYLAGWSETDGEDRFGMTYSYVDGRLNRLDVDRSGDDADDYLMTNDLSGNVDMKNANYDLNKVLYPYMIETELGTCSAVKTGTFGKYYFGHILVEDLWDLTYIPIYRTTSDANYKDVATYSTYLIEGFNEELGTVPITNVSYDDNGYPTEFYAAIYGREAEITITFAAGDVERVSEWDGTTYYEVVEVDREVTSSGPLEQLGKAVATIEYCD